VHGADQARVRVVRQYPLKGGQAPAGTRLARGACDVENAAATVLGDQVRRDGCGPGRGVDGHDVTPAPVGRPPDDDNGNPGRQALKQRGGEGEAALVDQDPVHLARHRIDPGGVGEADAIPVRDEQ
jgi:hypothetical protein